MGDDSTERPYWEAYLYEARKDGNSWRRELVTAGVYTYIRSVSAALDTAGHMSFSYSTSQMIPPPCPSFYCDGDQIDTSVGDATLAYDVLNRLHLAYSSASGLAYRCKADGVWYVPPGPGVDSVEYIDIALDSLQEPLIAYSTPGGVWLAHGIDVAGQSEERGEPTAYSLQPTASIVRNVLFLPVNGEGRMARSELMDASGRRVMVLKTGANDVRQLRAGVYFMRESTDGRTRKVLIAR
jgi:hypothetical protein